MTVKNRPMSRQAADAFLTALRGEGLPRDPVAFVAYIDRLAWSLAVFESDDDCCPVCQGELELWSDGAATYEHCTMLGCCFDAAGDRLDAPAAKLRPATRDEVRARYPSARLA